MTARLPLAAVLVLLELLLHRIPGDLVGYLFARFVPTPLLGIFVLIPGVVVTSRKMVCAAVGRALRTLSSRSLFVLYGMRFWLLPESFSSGQSFDRCC
jgi:hypothetical protein